MKTVIFLLAFCSIQLAGYGQSFRKYDISDSGTAIYLFSKPDEEFEQSKDDAGNTYYTGGATTGDSYYGIVCIRFNEKVKDKEEILIKYLDVLKDMLEIKYCMGYGKGHTLSSNPDAIGIIDICENKNETPFRIKGWIDNNTAALLYISNAKDDNFTKDDLFLNSFRFTKN